MSNSDDSKKIENSDKPDKVSEHKPAIRFRPDQAAIAQLGDFNAHGKFVMEVAALVLNESYTGCGLIVVNADDFNAGRRCCVHIPPLNPIRAEVVWRKEIDKGVVRLGIRYLE